MMSLKITFLLSAVLVTFKTTDTQSALMTMFNTKTSTRRIHIITGSTLRTTYSKYTTRVPTSTNTLTRGYYTSAWPYAINVQLQFGLYGAIRFYSNSRELYSCDVTEADGRVLCKMLGMPHGPASPRAYSTFMYRYGESFRSSLHCHGYETDIRYCSPPYPSYEGCYEAGLDCRTPARLVGFDGNPVRSGILEVLVNGTWGTVCDDNFDSRDADVFCRMLGFNRSSNFSSRYAYVTTSGTTDVYYNNSSHAIWLDDLGCIGYEADIAECHFNGWGQHNCGHDEDVILFCGTPARLVGSDGNPVRSGILEVLVNGTWGTVCDDNFDSRDADVFCRMLGFNRSSHFVSGYSNVATIGTRDPRSHPIWMDELGCIGYEADIAECHFNGWGQHDCTHNEDVTLFCVNESSPTTESYWWLTTESYWWLTTGYKTSTQYNWWYHTTTNEYQRPTTYWWHDTTAGHSLENVIFSSCTSSGWNIQVDMYMLRQIYPDALASDIYLGENSCTGYSNGYTLVFQHGIRSCLTSETTTQNALLYRNRLYYGMRDPQHPFIIRGYNWTVDVECDVMRNETVSSHISHNTQGPFDSGHVQGTSHYNITMRFYSDPNFQYEIPGNPLHVKVGDDVYVKAYTDAADWGVKMSVHSCYTKPDPYASDSLKYYIIRNGCEADVNTHYISQSTHETKFMFRDFEYTSNHEGLYLYCDAAFCETSDYSDQCQQSCNPRGKRDAESRPKLTETVQEKIIHNHK